MKILACIALALALTLNAAPASAGELRPVPGKPNLLMGAYDLGALGYQTEEYFLTGTATSYRLPGPPPADGVWNAEADKSAPYATRIVVVRPTDPAKFNGTLLVEWL